MNLSIFAGFLICQNDFLECQMLMVLFHMIVKILLLHTLLSTISAYGSEL